MSMHFDLVRQHIPQRLRLAFRRGRAWLLSVGLGEDMTLTATPEEDLVRREFSIIVAIRDAPLAVARCLEGLQRDARGAEILLVDDGSRLSQTLDLISGYGQRNAWKVLRHDEPVGHSRACEAGARLATRPFLCLLNSDAIVTPHVFKGVQQAFESDSRIAVVGPSTSCCATRQAVWRGRCCAGHWSDGQIRAFAARYTARSVGKAPVDLMVGGFAFFVRRSVWEQCGGFDANLPDYGNESELCRRLSRAGHRIVWTQSGYVHHLGGCSYGQHMSPAALKRQQMPAKQYIDRVHGGH